jgi:hypothetical protein
LHDVSGPAFSLRADEVRVGTDTPGAIRGRVILYTKSEAKAGILVGLCMEWKIRRTSLERRNDNV